MTTIANTEEKAMAISFPAPEAAATQRLERETGKGTWYSTLITGAAHVLKRGYERTCSAVFDAPGDCMRF